MEELKLIENFFTPVKEDLETEEIGDKESEKSRSSSAKNINEQKNKEKKNLQSRADRRRVTSPCGNSNQ